MTEVSQRRRPKLESNMAYEQPYSIHLCEVSSREKRKGIDNI